MIVLLRTILTFIIACLSRRIVVVLLCCCLGMSANAYENETELLFEANNGEQVDAYQGWFLVPENRENSESRYIRINYVRFPALNPKLENAAPIVYLSGGPGGSGIGTAKRQRFPLFMAMREFGDVVALDQRGLDENRLPCTSQQTLPYDTVIDDDRYTSLHRLALKECLIVWEQKGIDIRGYTTQQSVYDLDDLRRHLGAEKLSLWGISYGSHLALAALKIMEDRIDKVVIASVEGLNQTIKLPARTDRYFERLQSAINNHQNLRPRYLNIKSMISRVHAQLDKSPLQLELTKGNNKVSIKFQKRDMQSLASMMIADPQSALMLLDIYKAVDVNHTAPLAQLLSRYIDPLKPISFSGMSTAMDIASGISSERYNTVLNQVKTGLLADKLNFGLDHFDDIDGIDLGDAFREKPNSDVPTLVLSGTLDGRTYVESQAEAVSGLNKAVIVTIVNAGHNLFMSSNQVTNVIQRFMRGLSLTHNRIEIDLIEPSS